MPHPQKKLQIHASSDRRVKGKAAEELACAHLESRGFRILERNFTTRFGEIDIVAQRGKTVFFVEVRSSEGFMHPLESITAKKLKNLWRAIQIYARARGIEDYRTLLIGIDLSCNPPRIEEVYDFLEEKW